MTATDSAIDQIFMQQAQFLARFGEFLPGGVEALAKKLHHATESGKPLNIKLGLDPTRPDLHLGHSVVLRKLKAFQDFGHQVILIIGDATALIGDPSGRNDTRPPLTPEEIQVNAQTYLEQAAKVINVDQAKIVHNSEWLQKLNFADLLRLASNITVAQMLVREDFAKRYESNRPISLHELLYPLMQAYDSVVIEADIELGGTDQRFNTLLGRDFQLAYGNTNPQSVLLMPIIEGTDGKVKMSKSYPDHCINLTDTSQDMYGKLMSIPDHLICRYLELLTTCSPEVIKNLEANMAKGTANPRDIKGELAKMIVTDYHGREAAEEAAEGFIRQFAQNEIPENIPIVQLKAGENYHLPTLMADHNLASSKSDARRSIQGGGVKLDSEKVTDENHSLSGSASQEMILQVGRRRFLKLAFH